MAGVGYRPIGEGAPTDGITQAEADARYPLKGELANFVSLDEVLAETDDLYSTRGVPVFNVQWPGFAGGAKGDNVTNDTNAIAAAVAAANAAGGGRVYFPPGTYLGKVRLLSNVTIEGVGNASIIKLPNGANDHVIQLDHGKVERTCIQRLQIDGNRDNQTTDVHGIYMRTESFTQGQFASGRNQPLHKVMDVLINRAKHTGLYWDGDYNAGACFTFNVQTYHCNGHGIYTNHPDSHFLSCDLGASGLAGMAFGPLSANNHVTGVTVWWSGRVNSEVGYGFWIKGYRNHFTGCQAQDNKGDGWVLENVNNVMISGGVSDSDACLKPTDGAGIKLINSFSNMIDMVVYDRAPFDRTPGGTPTPYAISFDGTSARNTIDINVGPITNTAVRGTIGDNVLRVVSNTTADNFRQERSGVVPTADNTFSIGSSVKRWLNGFFTNLTLNGGSLFVTGVAGSNRDAITIQTAGVARWFVRGTNDAEGGSGAGTNFQLASRNDDGSFRATPLTINRQSSEMTVQSLVTTRSSVPLAANGAVTLNSQNGNTIVVSLAANATSSTITNPATGKQLTVTWAQDATGGRTYVWPTNCRFRGNTAPVNTVANTRTSVTFVYDGTNWNEINRAVGVGDAVLAEVFANGFISDDATKGGVLRSPNGKFWRLTVADDGAITTTDLGTTRPAS